MRLQHPWRLAAGVLAAVVVVLAVYAGWLLWTASHNLSRAADDASGLKAAALGDDPSKVAPALDDFAEHAHRAAEATDSPLWSLMTTLPWVGDDARGVRTVSRVADDLSRHGLRELTAAVGDIDGVVPTDGGVDLDKIESLVKPVDDGERALTAARKKLATEDPSGYVETLKLRFRDLQAKIDDAARAMTVADRALGVMPAMLGADGPRNYLLIMQNNAEIRATGGLPGAVSLLNADHGKLAMVKQVAGQDFGEAPKPVLPLSPAETKLFGENLGRYFLDANLTPDFARSSALWRARWEQTQPEKIDGVVSLDVVTLSYLLKALGPVDVDGAHLTADNAVDELLSKVYARFPDPADQDVFFRKVAAQIFSRVTSFSGSRKRLLQALSQAAGERRILIHDFHADVQKHLTATAVSGEVTSPAAKSPQVGIYFADGTLSKMSYYLRYNAQVQATSCLDGVQTLSGKLTLRSTAPKDAKSTLPSYVLGSHLPADSRGAQLVAIYVYAPVGGDAGSFDDNDLDFDQYSVVLNGRKVIATWVLMNPGQTRDLRWTMTSGAGQVHDIALRVTPSVVGSRPPSPGTAC